MPHASRPHVRAPFQNVLPPLRGEDDNNSELRINKSMLVCMHVSHGVYYECEGGRERIFEIQ